jgi:anti-sigma-K factor RskA
MERTGIHELSAAYALDALSAEERQEFEQHLAHCEECRETVAAFHDTAASLAHGVEAQQPPPELRARLLEQARAERGNVVPFRPRWTVRATSAVAAVAAVAAIAFGIWAATLRNQLGDRPEAFRLEGANGQLVVTPEGDAALIVDDLAPAPTGKTYEAWVIEGETPEPAGTFAGGGTQTAFALTRPVPEGATVAVTIEPEGGTESPTGDVQFSASGA